MGRECLIGFARLFELAHGRGWTGIEAREFNALSQPERNETVRRWATMAGDIEIEDRVGSDGQVYTAFWEREDD